MKRPRCSAFWFAYAMCLVLIVSLTCGLPAALAAEEEAAEESCAAALPEWAPKEPSKEFLRAAELLGFIPEQQVLPEGVSLEVRAFLRAMTEILWPRSFELFGSLTDEQVEKFLADQEVRLPISSLPPSQKTALDNWLQAVDDLIGRAPEAIRATDQTLTKGGYLALLREEGAAKDLSNVDVGFGARGAMVGVYFWIKKSPSGQGPTINNDFALLKPKEAPPTTE